MCIVRTGDVMNFSINVPCVCLLRTKLCKPGRFLGPDIRLKCNFEYLADRVPLITFKAAVKGAFPRATSTLVYAILPPSWIWKLLTAKLPCAQHLVSRRTTRLCGAPQTSYAPSAIKALLRPVVKKQARMNYGKDALDHIKLGSERSTGLGLYA